MSRESYARGFCKAAEAAGVDPQALAKYATNASIQAQRSANRAALRARIIPKMNALFKGSKPGETRHFSSVPGLQEDVDRFRSMGGDINDLKPSNK